MSIEEWRPIPGFEGLYEVSDCGSVRTVARQLQRKNGRKYTVAALIRKPIPNRYGYLGLRLSKDGATYPKEMHTLVALAFIGPRPDGADIRHLDGNKLNNSAPNLRYGTRSENLLDAVAHGTHGMTRKTHCSQGHPFDAMNTRETDRQRICRACARNRGRAYVARKRAERLVPA